MPENKVLLYGIIILILAFIVLRFTGCVPLRDPGKLCFQAVTYPQMGIAYGISKIGEEKEK